MTKLEIYNALPEKEPESISPSDYHISTPPKEYDLNYNLPVKAELASNALLLTPLIVSVVAQRL